MKITRRVMVHKTLWSAGATLALSASGRTAEPAPNPPRPGEDKPAAAPEALTRYITEWVVKTGFADVPSDVIEIGRKSILDAIGLALAGSVVDTGKISQTYLKSLGLSRPESTVIGTSMKVPPRFAAFVNGVGVHSADFDDTQLSAAPSRVYGLLTHPTVSAWDAALAVAESKGMSGRDLVQAYHLGVEVECKIAEAINPRHYMEGFHSTGTCGTFGAATAAGKLHGLDLEHMGWMMGIAGAEASGLGVNFGTMTKPFQAGHAAESGVVAAELAALGWTGASDVLESPRGYLRAAGGGYDSKSIFQKLGNPWTFASPGVSIKPFPCGSLSHPAMNAMQRLIRTHKVTADQVEEVIVGANRSMPTALIHHDPKTDLEAKFSMEFSMAALLLYGKAGLTQYTDEVVNRPEVQSMIKKVHMVIDPAAEAAGYDKMRSIVTVHLKDGKTFTETADFAKGSPADPMTFDEVAVKFEDCAEFAKWPSGKTKSIIETVRNLEKLPNVRMLTALCAS